MFITARKKNFLQNRRALAPTTFGATGFAADTTGSRVLRPSVAQQRCYSENASYMPATAAVELMHPKRLMIRDGSNRPRAELLQNVNTVPAPCAPPNTVVP
jgi:hypothetical protein